MTVNELIADLMKYDLDAIVYTDHNGVVFEVDFVTKDEEGDIIIS